MPKYEVHTRITAYNIYAVEAAGPEAARELVYDAIDGYSIDPEMADRILSGMMPDGFGDDESVYKVEETP